MNYFRDFDCNTVNLSKLNQKVKICGWIDTIRDHGNLIFIDLRDNYGITQCVADSSSKIFDKISKLKNESILLIHGKVVKRSNETINANIKTGEVEVSMESFEILSEADTLPLPVNSDIEYGEEVRLKYRF